MAQIEEASPSDAEDKVHRFMQWWDGGHGAKIAKANPILACIDQALLSDLIAGGRGYHTILTLDKLDALHRQFENSNETALEPLRRALQTRGGIKNQARAVGMMLFKEAMNSFEAFESTGSLPAPTSPTVAARHVAAAEAPSAVSPACGAVAAVPTAPGSPAAKAKGGRDAAATPEVALDEVWYPPRRWVCSPAFPPGAEVAARAEPSKESAMMTTFPEGTEYHATGIRGDYLQVHYAEGGSAKTVYVPWRIGDLEILVHADGAAPPQHATPTSHVAVEAANLTTQTSPAVATAQADTSDARVALASAQAPPLQRPPSPAKVASTSAVAPPTVSHGGVPMASPRHHASPQVGRLEVLEARVAQQDRQILALQCELAELRAHMGAIAAAFAPLSIATSVAT